MLNARFVPIVRWPGAPTKARKVAPFTVPYDKTLRELERELKHLQARDVLIQAYLADRQIRIDGWPRANERPSAPGVILTFGTAGGTLSFPCDTYAHYESNIRAISLSLTALRAIDRYGVTRRAEQYQGWKAIEPPSDQPFSTKQDAARFVVVQSADREPDFSLVGDLIHDRELLAAAYRVAANKLHPDKPTGSHELFIRLPGSNASVGGLMSVIMLRRGPFADRPLAEVPEWALYQVAEEKRLPAHVAAAVESELERRAKARRALRKAA